MNKYIDVEKLKAKVNELHQDWLDDSTGLEVGETAAELGAAESILDSIDEIIDSLQQEQPEVDFEKELKNERAKLLDAFGPMNGEQSLAIKNFARHFYSLGLNARKK